MYGNVITIVKQKLVKHTVVLGQIVGKMITQVYLIQGSKALCYLWVQRNPPKFGNFLAKLGKNTRDRMI